MCSSSCIDASYLINKTVTFHDKLAEMRIIKFRNCSTPFRKISQRSCCILDWMPDQVDPKGLNSMTYFGIFNCRSNTMLLHHGFAETGQTGSHRKFRKGAKVVVVPHPGKEIPAGTFAPF